MALWNSHWRDPKCDVEDVSSMLGPQCWGVTVAKERGLAGEPCQWPIPWMKSALFKKQNKTKPKHSLAFANMRVSTVDLKLWHLLQEPHFLPQAMASPLQPAAGVTGRSYPQASTCMQETSLPSHSCMTYQSCKCPSSWLQPDVCHRLNGGKMVCVFLHQWGLSWTNPNRTVSSIFELPED